MDSHLIEVGGLIGVRQKLAQGLLERLRYFNAKKRGEEYRNDIKTTTNLCQSLLKAKPNFVNYIPAGR